MNTRREQQRGRGAVSERTARPAHAQRIVPRARANPTHLRASGSTGSSPKKLLHRHPRGSPNSNGTPLGQLVFRLPGRSSATGLSLSASGRAGPSPWGAPVSDERGSRARLRFCLKPGPVYSAIVIDKVILRSSCVCRSLWVLDSCCFAHPLCLEHVTPQEVVASAVGSDRQKRAALGTCQ